LQTIATITLSIPVLESEQLSGLDEWLRSILWDSKLPCPGTGEEKFEIHRLKARLPLSNGDVKIVQGVRDVFDIVDAPIANRSTETASNSEGKVVLIGRNIVGKPFGESLINTIGV
tara:strand:+ start:395 stop:742 length:348 start_codon:yes stop_codon:yes gene_type:complete